MTTLEEKKNQIVEELFTKHQRTLKAILMRAGANPRDVPDYLQETLLRILKTSSSFEGRNNASPLRWAAVIAKRLVLDAKRRQKIHILPCADFPDEVDLDSSGDNGECADSMFASRFEDDVCKLLKPEQAELLRRRLALDNLEEAAKQAGISYSNAKIRMFRARKELQKLGF